MERAVDSDEKATHSGISRKVRIAIFRRFFFFCLLFFPVEPDALITTGYVAAITRVRARQSPETGRTACTGQKEAAGRDLLKMHEFRFIMRVRRCNNNVHCA